MSKKIRLYLHACTFAAVFVSCNNGSFTEKKQKKIINYIIELGIAKTTPNHYLIVPQHVCRSCVEATYDFFEQNKIPVIIILVGQSTRDSLQLVKKYPLFTIYLDRKELYYNRKNLLFSTQNMMFFTIDKRMVYNYYEINAANINGALNAILKDSDNQ